MRTLGHAAVVSTVSVRCCKAVLCAVLCAQTARFFYLLFQLHATDATLAKDGYWGTQGAAHALCQLGPGVALLALDTRSARTQGQVGRRAGGACMRVCGVAVAAP